MRASATVGVVFFRYVRFKTAVKGFWTFEKVSKLQDFQQKEIIIFSIVKLCKKLANFKRYN